jgi:hypothetical protein
LLLPGALNTKFDEIALAVDAPSAPSGRVVTSLAGRPI